MTSTVFKTVIEAILKALIIFFIAISIICAIIGLVNSCTNNIKSTTSPVESNRIDSITKENDKLIIEVEHLDSIKDAKVIEIKSLDNDSTLRLFYQLIGK